MDALISWLPLLAQTGEAVGPSFGKHLLAAVIYSAVGLVVFAISMVIITRVTPFSIRKEIEEDQNMALGIIVGAMLIGISMIIAAAIQG